MVVADRPRRSVSRLLDVVVSAAALVLFLPLMAACAAAIVLTGGFPVLFRQTRTGSHDRLFTLFKFRTMSTKRDAQGRLLPDEARLTAVGRFIRKLSLDELPQLFNVLKGDMALVGPRPLLSQYLPRYNEFQRRRHEVKPGITGWAQVNGRNALSWEEKFELDVWYVNHCSLWLDVRILLKTAWLVLTRQGISAPGQATMSEFLGSSEGPHSENGKPQG
jgi:lipopolysaccharide/colanic/teichoic acid biosynthesis glycosyltransferase